MALTFDGVTAGIGLDKDYGTFDSADSELVYLDTSIGSAEVIGTFSISPIAEAQQVVSQEMWETPLMGLGLSAVSIGSREAFEDSPIKQLIVQWFKPDAAESAWKESAGASGTWNTETKLTTDWST